MIKKLLIKVIIGIALVALLFVGVGYYALKSQTLSDYAKQAIIQEAARSGLVVNLREFSLFLLGANSKSATVFIPKLFSNLEFQDISVVLKNISPATVQSSATLFDGKVLTNARDLLSETIQGTAAITDINLALIPQLKALGVEQALLTFTVENFIIKQSRLFSSLAELTVKDFQSRKMSLPSFLTGLPMNITIPQITQGQINARCKFAEGTKLTCSKISIKSNLLNVQGSLDSFDSKTNAVQANFSVTPLDNSIKEMAVSALQIACSTKAVKCSVEPKPEHSTYDFSLSGTTKRPLWALSNSY